MADVTIDAVIAEAGSAVSESWIENDYKPAAQYWVAHTLTMQGLGTSTAAQLAGAGDFSHIKSGDLELRRGSGSGSGSASEISPYASTQYGKTYLDLRRRSFPAVYVI